MCSTVFVSTLSNLSICVAMNCFKVPSLLWFLSSEPFLLGTQGCKNIRSGGDSLKDVDSGPYLTYIVYKSWKTPGLRVRSTGRHFDRDRSL